MVECENCGRELKIVVPKGTPVYCNLCAHTMEQPDAPRKSVKRSVQSLISIFEKDLENELERFDCLIKEPYSFEQPYALIGAQGNIDHYRNILYWLKQNIGEVQEDVVDLED